MVKKCEFCGEKINNRNNKFCSTSCKKECDKRKLYLKGKSRGYALGFVDEYCKICGNKFKKKSKDNVYCSYNCRSKHAYQRKKTLCKLCGNEKEDGQRFYCLNCKSLLRKRRINLKINCEMCEKEFLRSRNQKYCSDECRKEINKIRYEKILKKKNKGYAEDKIKGICKVCGKEFFLRTPSHIFCSVECRKDYYENIQNFTIIEDNRLHKSLKLRFEILKRDNFTCQYCGRNPKQDKVKLQIDHIIPRSKGGKDIPSNLQVACFDCNQGKKDIILENKKLPKLNIIKIEVEDENL